MHIQQKNLTEKKNSDIDINISNENFINALNKQIARLKSDNKNLERQNKKLTEEKEGNIQAIRNLEQKLMNIQSNEDMNRIDNNINMNNKIQEYKNQINELTSQLNILHNENMSLQQNQRSILSSNMDSRGYPRSEVNNTSLQPNQL